MANTTVDNTLDQGCASRSGLHHVGKVLSAPGHTDDTSVLQGLGVVVYKQTTGDSTRPTGHAHASRWRKYILMQFSMFMMLGPP